MTYTEAVSFIQSLENAHYTPNHQTMFPLLDALGHPQDRLKVVHIAGTNGKGSIASYITSVCVVSGLRVGTFNSPHVLNYRELVSINQTSISEDDFAYHTDRLFNACKVLSNLGHPHPTAFEVLTALSLDYLANQKTDLAIIEVGLGGLTDATNVFDTITPLLGIISKIDYDHQNVLGHEITAIAAHKAGIIKKNMPVILAPNSFEVLCVINDKMLEMGGKLYILDKDLIKITTYESTLFHDVFAISTPHFTYDYLEKKLIGEHQYDNLAAALLAIKQLKKHYTITDEHIFQGIRQTSWPCRCEVINSNPLVLLDGAHNPDGMTALIRVIETYLPEHDIHFVFGVLGDKDIPMMLAQIAKVSQHITLTKPLSPRAKNLAELKDLLTDKFIDSFTDITIVENLYEAYDATINRINSHSKKSVIVCAGSLYLTMPIRDHIISQVSP